MNTIPLIMSNVFKTLQEAGAGESKGSSNTGIIIAIVVILLIIVVVVVVVIVTSSSSVTPTTAAAAAAAATPSAAAAAGTAAVTGTPAAIDYTQYFTKESGRWCAGNDKLSTITTISDDNEQTALKNCYNNDDCYQVNQVTSNQSYELLGYKSWGNPCDTGTGTDVLWAKNGKYGNLTDAKAAFTVKNPGYCAGYNISGDNNWIISDSDDDDLLSALNACDGYSGCYQVQKKADNELYLQDTTVKGNACDSGNTSDYIWHK